MDSLNTSQKGVILILVRDDAPVETTKRIVVCASRGDDIGPRVRITLHLRVCSRRQQAFGLCCTLGLTAFVDRVICTKQVAVALPAATVSARRTLGANVHRDSLSRFSDIEASKVRNRGLPLVPQE